MCELLLYVVLGWGCFESRRRVIIALSNCIMEDTAAVAVVARRVEHPPSPVCWPCWA